MFKHEIHETTTKGYEVYRDTRDGRRVFRAKGLIASSQLYREPGLPAIAPARFAVEEFRRPHGWANYKALPGVPATPTFATEGGARFMAQIMPWKYRYTRPEKRVEDGRYDDPGVVIGLSSNTRYRDDHK